MPVEQIESGSLAQRIATPSIEETEKHTSPGQCLEPLPIDSVESEAATETDTPSMDEREPSPSNVSGAESALNSGLLQRYVQPGKDSAESFGESRPSGPLSGFSLTPDFVFTGALTRGVCLACGAGSGADDLFCMACGVFIDEIASTLSFNETCVECKQGIEVGEIFCPWCGSSLPA